MKRKSLQYWARLMTSLRADQLIVGEPKTARSRRTVDLDAVTVDALRRHRREQVELRLLVGFGWVDTDLVFAGPHGSGLHPDLVSKAFVGALPDGLRRIQFRDLRHTSPSHLLPAPEPRGRPPTARGPASPPPPPPPPPRPARPAGPRPPRRWGAGAQAVYRTPPPPCGRPLASALHGGWARWGGWVSNPRTTDYESAALTAELPPRIGSVTAEPAADPGRSQTVVPDRGGGLRARTAGAAG